MLLGMGPDLIWVEERLERDDPEAVPERRKWQPCDAVYAQVGGKNLILQCPAFYM